jgi:hypothetical protein
MVDLEPTDCIDCLAPIFTSTTECGLASDPCYDCVQCPAFEGLSDCECLETPACLGCEAEAQGIWDCAARLCPTCVR